MIILYGEHSVWKLLNKDKYTKQGIKRMEQIYDFLSAMQKLEGNPSMKELFNMWNENPDETFLILSNLVND